MKTSVTDFETLEQAVKHFERHGVPLDEVLIEGAQRPEDEAVEFIWGDDFWQ
jgi:hypothetical protein